jgi:hypothetical protein
MFIFLLYIVFFGLNYYFCWYLLQHNSVNIVVVVNCLFTVNYFNYY